MPFRVCKSFEIESGHMLSKHPGRCRFPHGHSRTIEVVLVSPELDDNDMVCDFKALKLALHEIADRFDHALIVNSQDPILTSLSALPDLRERVVTFPGKDPTTEVLAKHIYDALAALITSGREFKGSDGLVYRLPNRLQLERVRVSETSSTWAEYAR